MMLCKQHIKLNNLSRFGGGADACILLLLSDGFRMHFTFRLPTISLRHGSRS
jgi:hypothetical protein